jgi:mannose-6-phosphate isomerase-like protein (cupin superfamily)
MANIYEPTWVERVAAPFRGRTYASARLRAERLGATLYEIDPGQQDSPFHLHHAKEELIIVLAGRPTLRTLEGPRTLEPGEVVACPVGRAGTHRYRIALTRPFAHSSSPQWFIQRPPRCSTATRSLSSAVRPGHREDSSAPSPAAPRSIGSSANSRARLTPDRRPGDSRRRADGHVHHARLDSMESHARRSSSRAPCCPPHRAVCSLGRPAD